MRAPRRRRATSLALLAVLGTLVACGEGGAGPSDPPGETTGRPVAYGDTVLVRLPQPGDTLDFTFPVLANQRYAIFMQGIAGQATLLTYDSALPPVTSPLENLLTYDQASVPTADLFDLRSDRLGLDHDGTIVLRVARGGTPGPVSFRFLVYAINSAPERVPAVLTPGLPLAGEDFENSADIDEWSLPVTLGDEYIGFVQPVGQSHDGARLSILGPGGALLETVAGEAAQERLESRGTGRLVAPATAPLRIRLSDDTRYVPDNTRLHRPYTFLLRKIDRRPEHVPATIALGDTVTGEGIDYIGDIDEFTITGPPGYEANLFFQPLAIADLATLLADTLPAGSFGSQLRVHVGSAPSLTSAFTGRLPPAQAGARPFRVSGEALTFRDGCHCRDVGPYRIYAYPINRAPESVPATVQLGDTVTGESIDLPGDIDEFALVVPGDTMANLGLWRDDVPQLLSLRVTVAGVTHGLVTGPPPAGAGPGFGKASGAIDYPAGTHAIEVSGSDFRGAYRFGTWPLSLGPESLPAALAIGDTVMDAIDRSGDVDTFTFVRAAGEELALRLAGGPGGAGPVLADVQDSTGTVVATLNDDLAVVTPRNYLNWTNRMDFPHPGTYRVRVYGFSDVLTDIGPYRLILDSFPVGPEHVPVTVTLGQSVTAELADTIRDLDEFRFTAPRDLALLVMQSQVVGLSPFWTLEVLDGPTGAPIARQENNAPFGPGPIPLAAGESVRIRVSNNSGAPTPLPYALDLAALDSLPELAPPTVGAADTVRGEAIFPVGDVDVFALAGAPGEVLTIEVTFNTVYYFYGSTARAEVLDGATGQVLQSATTLSSNLMSLAPVTLPAAGQLLLRISGMFDRVGMGGYEIRVQ